MESKNHASLFNLLGGKATFTNEPLLYRLTVMLLVAVFWLGAIWMLREVGLLTIIAKTITDKWKDVIKIIKGRAP